MNQQSPNEDLLENLKLHEEKYIEIEKLRIYCGTFNVNGKLCDESLEPWLCLMNKEAKSSGSPDQAIIDIYAIGIQELVDLKTKNLLRSSIFDERENSWMYAIEKELQYNKNFSVS